MAEDLALFAAEPAAEKTRRRMTPRRPARPAEQLDVLCTGEPVTYATPYQRSAAGVPPRVARRVGYDYISACRWCSDFVVLRGAWRRGGWIHTETGEGQCLQRRRLRGIWRRQEDGGVG